MKSHTIGRIFSAVIIGGLVGGAVHFDHLKRSQMGREDFLVGQGERFDRYFTKPDSVAVELLVGVFMAGALFGGYELLAFGIAKTVKGLGAREDNS